MHISLNVETLGEFLFSKSNHCREVAQLGRVLGLGPRCRRFESCLPDSIFGGVAQLARASGSYPGGRGFDPLRRYFLYIGFWTFSSAG